MIRTTKEQLAEIREALRSPKRLLNEKVWTFLVASILDTAEDQAPYVKVLCGEGASYAGRRFDPWFEAQPLSPRLGTPKVDHETNSKIDLAFGAVTRRGDYDSGIEFVPAWPDSWACFVEAKFLHDSASRTTNDPYRNQLERDIESLLCFQVNGQFPERLFFTLLTPRRFLDKPRARLYGYRIKEYQRDSGLLVEDIKDFKTAGRTNYGQVYPEPEGRAGVLNITWATYEDVLELAFGQPKIDTLDPTGIADLQGRLNEIAEELEATD
jgi:hypothetical protein